GVGYIFRLRTQRYREGAVRAEIRPERMSQSICGYTELEMTAVFRFSYIALLLLLPWDLSFAQHNHGRRNVLEISYETSPVHDEVLKVAPSDLMLRFNDYVQLVKLTLK